jgi:hypothetical protein
MVTPAPRRHAGPQHPAAPNASAWWPSTLELWFSRLRVRLRGDTKGKSSEQEVAALGPRGPGAGQRTQCSLYRPLAAQPRRRRRRRKAPAVSDLRESCSWRTLTASSSSGAANTTTSKRFRTVAPLRDTVLFDGQAPQRGGCVIAAHPRAGACIVTFNDLQ